MSELCCARSPPLRRRARVVESTPEEGAERKAKMLSSMNIGKRMGLAFGVLVALALVLAGSGYWGLQSMASMADHVLLVDVAAAEASGDVQAGTLNLRRYEKDFLLTMGSPAKQAEYLEKWKAQHKALFGLFERMSSILKDEESKRKINTMRTALAGYDEGFERVREAVRTGAVKTPAEANEVLT